jgi:hypothetical protein
MDHLMDARCKQLQEEAEVDRKLKSNCKACQGSVLQYLWGMRELNRHLSKKLYDAPFYKMPGVYSDNLEVQDHIQNTLHGKGVTCEAVQEMNEYITNKLQE